MTTYRRKKLATKMSAIMKQKWEQRRAAGLSGRLSAATPLKPAPIHTLPVPRSDSGGGVTETLTLDLTHPGVEFSLVGTTVTLRVPRSVAREWVRAIVMTSI